MVNLSGLKKLNIKKKYKESEVMDCKNNNDGKCENKWPIGTEAISLKETYTGHLICTDCELEDEEREEL